VNSFSFNCLKGSTINVYSNGLGNKRGVLVNGSNIATTRDLNIYVAQPSSPTLPSPTGGSYVGVETADSSNTGSIQLRSTTIGTVSPTAGQTYTASDILQTNPSTILNPTYLASAGIQIGPGTDLITKTAGGKSFSTFSYPTTLFYGSRGVVTNTNAGWLWVGTQAFSNSTPKYPDDTIPAAFYKIQQPIIVSGITVSCTAAPGVGKTAVFTVCKNTNGTAPGGVPNGATVMTVTLSGTETEASYYNKSVNFSSLDKLSLYFITNSTVLSDPSVQIDCF
jgi:hypothetical protein